MRSLSEKFVWCRKTLVRTWAVGMMPMLQQLQLTRTMFTMTKCLGKIWKVHPNLEKAILDELFQKEGGKGVLKNVLFDLGAAIGLGGTVAAVVLTGGIATLLISVYIASAFAQSRGVSRLIMVYSVLIMGVIPYVRARKLVVDTNTDQKQQQQQQQQDVESYTTGYASQCVVSFVSWAINDFGLRRR
jgi:hypothetical protein